MSAQAIGNAVFSASGARNSFRFRQFAWVTLAWNLLVIVWGAFVRASGSGAGCATGQEAILIPEGGVDFDAEMEKIEIAYLNAALRRTGGKKSAAAELLQIDPQRMKYLCRKHRID